jgi:Fe-S-cluster-containing dehydrogenase component/DMSO reductase anchor subunit
MMNATSQETKTLVDVLLEEQSSLTAVEKFSRSHALTKSDQAIRKSLYTDLLPIRSPKAGEQYAFSVDLDRCSGCKACVSACHSLNGLEDGEVWRSVGLLASPETRDTTNNGNDPSQSTQHVTTACHHCADPGCLNGCPVLAYEKDEVTGIVRHLDDQCIGCSYCVMKCPYEVPKFSARLGIVRKCDMCANRLAVGEAPACAQACPTKAIKITLVESNVIKLNFRDSNISESKPKSIKGSFLPGSPNPSITLPTTQYLTNRKPLTTTQSADQDYIRLDHAHWPLVIMLVLTQTAAGIALGAMAGWVEESPKLALSFSASTMFVLTLGLMASVCHLGRPTKAWRAFLGWRKSWLSREIIAFNIFAGAASAALFFSATGNFFQKLSPVITGFTFLAAALAGLLAVGTSAMVYIDTKRPFWSPVLAVGSFFGTVISLGMVCSAMISAYAGASTQFIITLGLSGSITTGALFVWRRGTLKKSLSDPQSPIFLNARSVEKFLPRQMQLGVWLFALSIASGLTSALLKSDLRIIFLIMTTAATLASEILWRYIFFKAGASKRMPGGIAS